MVLDQWVFVCLFVYQVGSNHFTRACTRTEVVSCSFCCRFPGDFPLACVPGVHEFSKIREENETTSECNKIRSRGRGWGKYCQAFPPHPFSPSFFFCSAPPHISLFCWPQARSFALSLALSPRLENEKPSATQANIPHNKCFLASYIGLHFHGRTGKRSVECVDKRQNGNVRKNILIYNSVLTGVFTEWPANAP